MFLRTVSPVSGSCGSIRGFTQLTPKIFLFSICADKVFKPAMGTGRKENN